MARQGEGGSKAWYKILLRVLFSHGGLLVLVIGYSVLGAWLFVWLEQQAERDRLLSRHRRALEVNDSLNYMVALLWYWHDKNFSQREWEGRVYSELKKLDIYIVQSVGDSGYDGTTEMAKWELEWNMPNSLLYVITIISTIGYGQIAPSTSGGKLATILYAIVGIPLLLVFLANIGEGMAQSFRFLYSRVLCRWCRARRRRAEYGPSTFVPPISQDKIGSEEYMPTDQVAVPIILNLMLISLYILIGSILFSTWEGWDIITSAYFTFITLTTVGFGDYVPGKSFLGYRDGISNMLIMFATCFYVLLGMALVSMCINLMQEQIIEKVKWLGQEIGLIKDGAPSPGGPNVYPYSDGQLVTK